MKLSNITKLACASSLAALTMAASPSSAAYLIFEDLPTAIAQPPNISWHNASGPVIADDFTPSAGGHISHVTWWGSNADDLNFEVVLQNDNPTLHQPDLTPAGNNVTGGLKQFVVASKSAGPIAGVFRYDADIAAGWDVAAGKSYWFTVGNFLNGWEWAEALGGPTVGAEFYNAHRSTGPGCLDGGPHCGPWNDIHTDFAFRIAAVPEPATWALMIGGFGLIGVASRRRKSARMQTA